MHRPAPEVSVQAEDLAVPEAVAPEVEVLREAAEQVVFLEDFLADLAVDYSVADRQRPKSISLLTLEHCPQRRAPGTSGYR